MQLATQPILGRQVKRALLRSAPLRRGQQGFTLVEISIVLVIIGLILGGILNAQSVIRNAQTKDSIKALTVLVDLTVAIEVGVVLAAVLFVHRMAEAVQEQTQERLIIEDEDDVQVSDSRRPEQPRVLPSGVRATVKAVIDNQELDSRVSTGAIYWEGLSELYDSNGKRVGLGYLEMTGYAKPLRM